MPRIVLSIVALLAASSALAGERIVGTNTYHVNEQNWHTGGPTGFWMQNNYGTFEVTEGPLESGSVECHGSGFWDGMAVTGSGICIYESDESRHIWRYEANPGKATTGEVVHGTGKYEGMTGRGKSATRKEGGQMKMGMRVTDWAGEIELPK
jgi:hypothetical protein